MLFRQAGGAAKIRVERLRPFHPRLHRGRQPEDFTGAIRLAPVAPVYFNRGFTYDRKGEHDRAISDYGEALRLDPQFTQAYYQRGLTYAKTGQYRQAIADLTEVIRLAPKDFRAYAIRAKAYRALGDEAKAIRDESKAGELEE